MTDSILCTVKQVEAILVVLQGQRFATQKSATNLSKVGDTPTSQNVWGVLIWSGLQTHIHNRFPNLGKKN